MIEVYNRDVAAKAKARESGAGGQGEGICFVVGCVALVVGVVGLWYWICMRRKRQRTYGFMEHRDAMLAEDA